MARRAIKELYLEFASLRNELKVVEQQVRVALRPRLDLELLLPERSEGFTMRPSAPDFVPTLSEVLPEYIESVCKTGSLNQEPPVEKERLSIEAGQREGDDPVVDRHGNFKQYDQSNVKPAADICSLGSLKGQFWERLSDDQALDRTFQSFQKRGFVNVSRWIEKYTYVYDSFCAVLPLLIQQEDTEFKQMEAHFDEVKEQLEEDLETVCDLRSRASKCQDNPVGTTAASAEMRNIESLTAKQLAIHDQIVLEKAEAGRQSVIQRLWLEILQSLAPALTHGHEDVTENLQNQWEKLGL